VEHISSRQNPLVKRVRDLARGRGPEGEVLLEGVHLLEEAWRSNVEVLLAVFASDALDGRLSDLAVRAAAHGARVVSVPPALLGAISPVRQSAGVLAVARLRAVSMDDALREKPALLLLLEGIQDPGNVGAIVRAGEACGATGVIAGPGCADPFGWKAVRGSMGSVFRLPVVVVDAWAPLQTRLRREQVRVFAAVPRGGTPLTAVTLESPSAILLGGEGPGLSPELLVAADEQLTIEMRSPVESLNVAISAALVLYEASRQRSHVTVR
jgi:TrmH family RNA methyltransferase